MHSHKYGSHRHRLSLRLVLSSRLEQSLKAAGSEGKFTFIVFSKEDNAAAREMLGVVETGVAERHEQAVVVTARANDPAEQPLDCSISESLVHRCR